MRFFSAASMLFGATAIAAAIAPYHPGLVVHEQRQVKPDDFVKHSRLDSDDVVTVRIGLTQGNLALGEDALMDVSDPTSKNYGKHWTSEKVADFFKPTNETVEIVREWLMASGIEHERIMYSGNKAWIAFDALVTEAEELLQTEYHEWEHIGTGTALIACDEYHLPALVHKHVDYLTPGVKLSVASKHGSHGKNRISLPLEQASFFDGDNGNLSTCDQVMTPDCIKALYKIPQYDNTTMPNPNNTIGIFEEGDAYAEKDLDQFFANYTPYIPPGTYPMPLFIDGAEAPKPVAEAGGESDMDFQVVYPIVYPQTVNLFQTDDAWYSGPESNALGYFDTFLDAIDGSFCNYTAYNISGNNTYDPIYPNPNPGGWNHSLMCGTYVPTNVISISYGGLEVGLPPAYQKRQCNEFMKLGLQGVSVLFASGDSGVGGRSYFGESNCLGKNSTTFNPGWPSTCPWVTNVGATKVYPGKTVFDNESAVYDPAGHPYPIDYSSGGGFSNIYGIPKYQRDAVKTYFDNHDPGYPYYSTFNSSNNEYDGLYNRIGRGYPDVAANGDNIASVHMGKWYTTGGTSASAPIFASILDLINEARMRTHKSPVGFVNPVLYLNPQVLNDITNGTNPGCGTQGFSAVQGWDPVTGLGTPDYEKMLDMWLSLP